MELFGTFEAVKFPEENLIFITKGCFLYYIFNPKCDIWEKHWNAGNDYLTVSNYQDISREELMKYMKGIFPTKETDFMRLCNPEQLCIRDMLDLLCEDYKEYIEHPGMHHIIHRFLLESDICHKSYLEIRKVLDNGISAQKDSEVILTDIKRLCLEFMGRDIFKKEIGIVDGHDSSSYFWIIRRK